MRLETETLKVVNETPEEDSKETQEYGLFHGSSLLKCNFEKVPIIEHILYERDTIFISAQSGVGKSILTLQMLANLTMGEPFLDSFTIHKPRNVLLLQTEGDRVETIERVMALSKGIRINHTKWAHLNLDGICLNTEEGYDKFTNIIAEIDMHYDVIIIDPLYTTVKGSLNSDEVATDWVRNIRRIRRLYNCSFIVNHHDSIKEHFVEGVKQIKPTKDLMGSSFWGAFANYNFKLSVNSQGVYTFTSGKERNRKVIDTITMRLIEPEPLMFVMADEQFNLSEAQVYKLITDSVGVGLSKIMELTKLSRATCFRALKKLHDSGKIEKIHGSKGLEYTSAIKENVLDK